MEKDFQKQFSTDKLLQHLDRIEDWINEKNPYPIHVELDMTNECNGKCPDCIIQFFRNRENVSLSNELAEKIIRELAEVGVKAITFTGGGEPLMHPYTPKAIELAKSLGVDVGLITNGSLINEKDAEIILKNCTWVRVSLDADNPKTYKKTHGLDEKEFNRVLDNVKLLIKLRKKLKSNCTIGTNYLTSDRSKNGMLEGTKLAKSLGVDYVQFRPIQVHGEREGKFGHYWTNVSKELEECKKLADENFDVLLSLHKYQSMKAEDLGRVYGKCYGMQFIVIIAANGKVYPCCHTKGYEKYSLGNLNKQSFKEIWNSEQKELVMNSIDFKDCIPLCRYNAQNQILWNLKKKVNHVNFI